MAVAGGTAGKRQSLLQGRGRMSLTGYNCVLVPGSHGGGTDDELPLPPLAATGTSSSSASSSPARVGEPLVDSHQGRSGSGEGEGRRQSQTRHERRGRARMSLAGYNETAYYGAVNVVADNDDCSSTRDSSNFTHTDSGIHGEEGTPWAVWRRWAADSDAESGLSDIDSGCEGSSFYAASAASDSDRGLSRRRSARRSARASLAGYNCTGAVSVTGEDGFIDERGASSRAAEAGERLSTIGEVLEMGLDWWGEGSSAAATAEPRHEHRHPTHFRLNSPDDYVAEVNPVNEAALVEQYESLDEVQNDWRGWGAWADDTEDDDTLDMGLQDDPIAEAGFIFAVEYGQACIQGIETSRVARE